MGVRHGRVIDQHHNDLAPDVHALEIVPPVFGRHDAIAHKNQVGFDVDRGFKALGPGHKVIGEFERLALPAGFAGEHQLARWGRL